MHYFRSASNVSFYLHIHPQCIIVINLLDFLPNNHSLNLLGYGLLLDFVSLICCTVPGILYKLNKCGKKGIKIHVNTCHSSPQMITWSEAGEFLIELNILMPNYVRYLRANKSKRNKAMWEVLYQEFDHVHLHALVNIIYSLCHTKRCHSLLSWTVFSCNTSHLEPQEAQVSIARLKQNIVVVTSKTQA